jgi:hypothetical protein
MITTLRIKKTYETNLEVACRYYRILNILNELKLSPMEIKLLAFLALEDNLSTGGRKEKFCDLFKCPKNSVYNISGRMIKKRFLVKVDGKIKINPQLHLDFNNTLLIRLQLDAETK